jgi:uncharacterized protein (TIGR03084 family)
VVDRSELLADLRAESADLDSLVAGLSAVGWAMATPATGWTVAHQIAHLTWTDEVALLAVTEPDAFQAVLRRAIENPNGFVDEGTAEVLRGGEPLARWRDGRVALAAALAEVPDGVKLVWFGPPMSPASMATARIMETWAHGQDVADALGVERTPTARLRHVAHLGVRTRVNSYLTHGLAAPTGEVRVELAGPDGELWTWGPVDAPARLTGPALDFCLLVTQRRHRDDLALDATGDADTWLDVAQAFAGPPGPGRPPRAEEPPGADLPFGTARPAPGWQQGGAA